jgi:hypothetical protein
MEEQTFKDLLDFVYAKTLLSKNVALGPNSRLCEDVGLTGWDAHEFFMAYADRFQSGWMQRVKRGGNENN